MSRVTRVRQRRLILVFVRKMLLDALVQTNSVLCLLTELNLFQSLQLSTAHFFYYIKFIRHRGTEV